MSIRDNRKVDYALKQELQEKGYTERDTYKSFLKNNQRFAEYLKQNGCNRVYKVKDKFGGWTAAIQGWIDSMVADGRKATTIHTYAAAPCCSLGIPMGTLKKPVRSSSDIVKGRQISEGYAQGKHEEEQERFRRIVEFQKATGIRRDELRHLTGSALKKDESGHLCIEVVRGKGGKHQLQRILPQHEEIVKKTFADIAPDQRIFAQNELNNKINFHSMRAKLAREAYEYYLKEVEAGGADRLCADMKLRWSTEHIRTDQTRCERSYQKFCNEMKMGDYVLRGANRERFESLGLPTRYNRVALLAVSVFHLSHWRSDVTVINYMA